MPWTVAGEPRILAGAWLYAPMLFQNIVEIPQVSHCELGKLLLSQIGHDVMCQVIAVVVQSARPKGEGHLLQPVIQPLCQGHAAILCQVDALVGVDLLPEPGCQLLLGVRVEVAENGGAVCLVAHHNTPLPPAIRPLPHHTVTGRSALCHAIHLLTFYL